MVNLEKILEEYTSYESEFPEFFTDYDAMLEQIVAQGMGWC